MSPELFPPADETHMSRKAAAVAHLEDDARRALAQRGLELRVSWSRQRSTVTPHWMVERGTLRVLDFWPATGRWRCPATGATGQVRETLDVVELAAGIDSQLT